MKTMMTTASATSVEDSAPPPVIRLLSIQSYKNSKLMASGGVKQRKKRQKTKHEKTVILNPELLTELTFAATLWSAWTGKIHSLAPWMPREKEKPFIPEIRLTSKPSITRFDRQSRGIFRNIENMACFSGTCGTLKNKEIKKHITTKQQQNAFRVCLVFWSPMAMTALRGELDAKGHEVELFTRIQAAWNKTRKNRRKQKLPTLPLLDLSLAYVIPRWRKCSNRKRKHKHNQMTNKYITKLITEEPRILSYGIWQLGTRINLIKPDLVISTSKATSLIVSNLAKIRPRDVIGEQHPTPKLMQMESESGLKIGVQETISDVCRRFYDTKWGYTFHSFEHFRCPHPMLLLKTERESETSPNNIDTAVSTEQFQIVMHGLTRLAIARSNRAAMSNTTSNKPSIIT